MQLPLEIYFSTLENTLKPAKAQKLKTYQIKCTLANYNVLQSKFYAPYKTLMHPAASEGFFKLKHGELEATFQPKKLYKTVNYDCLILRKNLIYL